MQRRAVLLLDDGNVYHGKAIGKIGTAAGEICFNTGMTGYQEIYTDPSYYGQIIVNTTSHIGNYGTYKPEEESENVQIRGVVVKMFSEVASRNLADDSLQNYLEKAGIVGICGVDTRKIVKHIRQKGAMNCIISSDIEDIAEIEAKLKKVPSMEGLELSSEVTCKEPYFLGKEDAAFKVAVLDLGVKKSILTNLAERGCYCKVFPAKTSFEEMNAWNPDGFFISNGPGDPAATDYALETIKEILNQDLPLFGICMGHQLLARAMGIPTFKMHQGHRGLNHPVKNLVSGLSEITSQNHGFCVEREAVEKHEQLELTHINLNDETVEGIKLKNKKAFSVQYHPESSPGPHDSRYLFDNFIEMMKA
ncbi:glutamine-hydrolyzing carbamoyl-phosphate synthase small subunit [Rapidithrix thailandica]|uniref:Carbamoyl phosphate synthase small chain n=1 Tax=Rapidithrix thailandica TaxID=413964 RepID=A0AAW9S6H7_9BACT